MKQSAGTAKSTDQGNNYLIESIDNGSRILLMLRDQPIIRAADVAKELGVARSTAHRMVSTLQHRGLLKQDAQDKTYSAGYALVELGLSVIGATDLSAEALPYLVQLTADVGETSHLLVLEEAESVFVTGVESGRVIRAALRIGARFPAHITAAGRCMLAALPEERIKELYPGTRLRGGTTQAIHTRNELLVNLRQVREASYAINDNESEDDLVAVAMPLIDSRGDVRASITVSGPSARMHANLSNTLTRLRTATDELAAHVLR